MIINTRYHRKVRSSAGARRAAAGFQQVRSGGLRYRRLLIVADEILTVVDRGRGRLHCNRKGCRSMKCYIVIEVGYAVYSSGQPVAPVRRGALLPANA
jgi:hypothetical protein